MRNVAKGGPAIEMRTFPDGRPNVVSALLGGTSGTNALLVDKRGAVISSAAGRVKEVLSGLGNGAHHTRFSQPRRVVDAVVKCAERDARLTASYQAAVRQVRPDQPAGGSGRLRIAGPGPGLIPTENEPMSHFSPTAAVNYFFNYFPDERVCSSNHRLDGGGP